MEGIGMVMPLENEMVHPQHFLGYPGVLNVSMVIVISLYGGVGFFGYVQFGDIVTLNLPQEDLIAQSAKIIMAIVIYFSYALQFYVPMDFVNRLLKKRESVKYDNVIQISFRTIMVTITVAVAAAFPNLELVISLVGAISFSTLELLISAIVDTVYLWDRDFGKFNYVLIKNIIDAIVAIIALISGSYVSVLGMIEDLSGHNQHNATLT